MSGLYKNIEFLGVAKVTSFGKISVGFSLG